MRVLNKLGSDESFKSFVLKSEIFLSDLHIDFIAIDFGLNQYGPAADGAVFGIGLRFGGVDQNGDALPAKWAGDLFFVEMHNGGRYCRLLF